jgi:hypothetical protein
LETFVLAFAYPVFIPIIYYRRTPQTAGVGRQGNDSKKGGKTERMGLRAKFVFLLVVYAAGFLTAIYCLAPTPDQAMDGSGRQGFALGNFKSDELARSVNSGMHKAIAMGKEAAQRAAVKIKEKIDEAQSKSDG